MFAPFKISQQVLSILYAFLWRIPRPPEFILVQVRSLTIFAQSGIEQWRRTLPASLPWLWYG